MKLFFTFFLALLVSFEAEAQNTYCINAAKLNLRDAPTSSGSNIIGQFTRGKQVIVFEVTGNWAKVLVDGQNGYVWRGYLTECSEIRNFILGENYNNGKGGSNSSTNTTRQTTSNANPNYGDGAVIICNSPNAYAYHRYECKGLARCGYGTSNISREKAESMGRRPCQKCYK